MSAAHNGENVTCHDCAILSRQLEAARNRIADDCESSEKALARAVAERRQFERQLRWWRGYAFGMTVAAFAAWRLQP